MSEETTQPGDHTDSPHGYWHYEIVVEADPRINDEELMDHLFGGAHDVCTHLSGDPTGEQCAFEHHESATHVKCALWERGESDVRHVEQ